MPCWLPRGQQVLPEASLRKRVTHSPLPSTNKAAHSGFETQRKHYQKSKTGVSVAPQKRTGVLKNFFFKKRLPGSGITRMQVAVQQEYFW